MLGCMIEKIIILDLLFLLSNINSEWNVFIGILDWNKQWSAYYLSANSNLLDGY